MSQDKNIDSEEQAKTSAETPELSANEDLAKQIEKYKNDYLYLRAEFENYKRNAIKERADYLKYGSERIVVEVLNVVDNFDRALESKVTSENLENYVKGVQMTTNELKSILQRNGVQEIKSEGQPFDPMVHEAIGAEPTDEVSEGNVFRVFKKAYKLHDKVIRAAQVIVAKAKI